MKPTIIACFLPVLFLVSCTQYAYYQSPLHTNTNSYKAMPTKNEGKSPAIYGSGAITTGGVNDNLRDGFTAFIGSVHRSHNLGQFQAYYGLSGSLGRYKVDSVTNSENMYANRNLNASLINSQHGSKFFGSWGAVGGINVVIPFRKGGEWRAIGTELSWSHEFGKYLDFRKKLPDTAANMIDRNRNFLTIAINTDILIPITDGSIGCKIALVFNPRNIKGFDKNRIPENYSSSYLAQTFHVNIRRVTGFCQLNFGSFAFGAQLGASVRISK